MIAIPSKNVLMQSCVSDTDERWLARATKRLDEGSCATVALEGSDNDDEYE